MVLIGFMFIVGTSRTGEPILVHFMVYHSSQYLPTYHTQPGSQVTKMLDFVDCKKNMLILHSFMASATISCAKNSSYREHCK